MSSTISSILMLYFPCSNTSKKNYTACFEPSYGSISGSISSPSSLIQSWFLETTTILSILHLSRKNLSKWPNSSPLLSIKPSQLSRTRRNRRFLFLDVEKFFYFKSSYSSNALSSKNSTRKSRICISEFIVMHRSKRSALLSLKKLMALSLRVIKNCCTLFESLRGKYKRPAEKYLRSLRYVSTFRTM